MRKLLPLILILLSAACTTTGPTTSPTTTAPASAAAPAAPLKYVMIMGANRAGTQSTVVKGNTRMVDFEFNDRGRGPNIHSVIKLDQRGLPIEVHNTGNDYYKGRVDETLATTGGVTRWKNKAEGGEKPAGAFYVSMYGPPEEMAILARALLNAPGNRLPLLPAGEASIRKISDLTLDGKVVTQYEVTGLGFTPHAVWLDENRELFATVDSWSSVIREGFEEAIPKLLAEQETSEKQRWAEIATQLTRRPAAIAITNARLFDPKSLAVTPNTTIVVRGNRIEAVGANVAIPADAERIDAAGKTVMPGMWDMHTHLGETDGPLNIAAGITSVRDLANDTDFVVGLKKSFDEGTAIGPRVILAGFLDGPGPYTGPTKVIVDTEDEVRAAIDRYAELGYVQVKIYSSIRPTLVPYIVAYAKYKGLRVSGHIPAFMTAEQAVMQGFDEIQHINMLLLNFMPDVKDTRTPARFTAVAERAAGIQLNSIEMRAFIDLLRDRRVVVDPTINAFEEMFTFRPGVMPAAWEKVAPRLPPQVSRGFLTGGLPIPEGMEERYRQSYQRALELLGALYKAGITIVAGTDALGGFTYHRELELYVQAGIPAPEVLRIATLGAARVANRDKELGTIEPGKLADIIIVDGDPTTNISDIRNVRTVVKDGKVFDSAAVYRAIGVQ